MTFFWAMTNVLNSTMKAVGMILSEDWEFKLIKLVESHCWALRWKYVVQKNKTIDTSRKIITSWTLVISGDFNKNPMEIGAWTSVSEHLCENLCWMYARACVQGTTLIMLNNLNALTFVNLYNCAHLIPIYSIIQIRHLCTVYVWVTQLEATSLWVYSWIIV